MAVRWTLPVSTLEAEPCRHSVPGTKKRSIRPSHDNASRTRRQDADARVDVCAIGPIRTTVVVGERPGIVGHDEGELSRAANRAAAAAVLL